MSLVRAFHAAYHWNLRIMFTLPREQDAIDMVQTRVDPMLKASPLLTEMLGEPNTMSTKKIGNSYLFFMYLTIEPRSMPGDIIFIDEVDLSDPDNLRTALNRLDASRWKLNYYISTPTISNFGIDALFRDSDMRRWIVKCPHCNEYQQLDWNKNVRVIGNQDSPDDVYYMCHKCSGRLSMWDVSNGQWIAERPERTPEHVGFHISQMMTTNAMDMWKIWRDPQTNLVEFWRKRLGTPYEIGGGSISRDDFLVNCFDEPYDWEDPESGEQYYLGADQGNELQVVVGKNENGRIKIVHIEIIPKEEGFDRLEQLIRLYKVRRAVIDANPNRHKAIEMRKRFPGRVLIADYAEQKKVWNITKQGDKDEKQFTNVSINRTTGFDGLMESVKKGMWMLPGNPPRLPHDVELLIDQATALKRDVEMRKTKSGGEVPTAVYRSIRADHLGHAMLYLKTAVEIAKGGRGKIAVIGKPDPEEKPNPLGENAPEPETVIKITALLAEARLQLPEFLANTENPAYKMPFPLSYKWQCCLDEGFELNDILFVAELLAEQ